MGASEKKFFIPEPVQQAQRTMLRRQLVLTTSQILNFFWHAQNERNDGFVVIKHIGC